MTRLCFLLQALQYQLDVLSLQTDKLILRFFSDLANIQTALVNSGEDKYGKVLLSVGYHQDKESIEVNLFQANKLPGLDSSGNSVLCVYRTCIIHRVTLILVWVLTAPGVQLQCYIYMQSSDTFQHTPITVVHLSLPTGLSDPFVELTLMPPWNFGHTQSKKQKTSVKKETVNPVFNEDILM